MEPIEFDIGKALMEGGFTWSDGTVRGTFTTLDLIQGAIRPVLKKYGVIPKEC